MDKQRADKKREMLARLLAQKAALRPGVKDDFFALGSDSFLATLLLTRAAARFNVGSQLSLFFYEPTGRHLTGLLQQEQGVR